MGAVGGCTGGGRAGVCLPCPGLRRGHSPRRDPGLGPRARCGRGSALARRDCRGGGLRHRRLVWGLPVAMVATDAIAHGLAAMLAAFAMRSLARRREIKSKTSDWLIFLVGVCVFTVVVAAELARRWLGRGARRIVRSDAGAVARARVRAARHSHFRCRARQSWRIPRIKADPRPAIGVLALAAFLLGVLWLLLSLPMEQVSPSGVTLLLSVPFCLWVAMQRRSLDGAALSFLASHVALVIASPQRRLDRSGRVRHRHHLPQPARGNLPARACRQPGSARRARGGRGAQARTRRARRCSGPRD